MTTVNLSAEPRRLYLEFEGGPRAIAVLQDRSAPRLAEAMWGAFEKPATAEALHAIYSGHEIMIDLPEANRNFDAATVPQENLTVIPAPGDLMFFHQGATQMAGLDFEMWEVGIFYGRGARAFGPLGWVPCPVWATISEGLEEFAEACVDMRRVGVKKLTIGRI